MEEIEIQETQIVLDPEGTADQNLLEEIDIQETQIVLGQEEVFRDHKQEILEKVLVLKEKIFEEDSYETT